jgi:hypothetical protein
MVRALALGHHGSLGDDDEADPREDAEHPGDPLGDLAREHRGVGVGGLASYGVPQAGIDEVLSLTLGESVGNCS